ncbi:hypothetical protein AAFG13_34815 [Bradyrhizobium sp. B124]|uniref:hypothetical protein n=1 Tax=Bradyrhizobium sp. B124 TaxID=3140245 RepID=UPI003182E402
MIEAFFGAPDMATGILIDQLGTYLVLSTLGITVAAIYSAGSASGRGFASVMTARGGPFVRNDPV